MYINGKSMVIKISPVTGASRYYRSFREIMVDADTVDNEPFISPTVMSAKLLMQILNQITRLKKLNKGGDNHVQ